MRIGIDAREVSGRATGVGRYLGGLLRAWSADGTAERHQFVLYAQREVALPGDRGSFTARLLPGRGGTWWEQVTLSRAAAMDRLDVFFAPGYEAPIGLGVPTVVAIHDLSFFACPAWFRLSEGARRRWLTRASATRARAVITISEFSKDELVEHLGVDPGRIHVIPPGIDVPPVRSHARVPRVLFAGSIFNRRHVPDLIRAFAPIARMHPSAALDIVGDNRSYPCEDLEATIAAEELAAQARWHRYATDDALQKLYEGARAFAWLSEYEGLGLTPLEALGAGIPPVLLDTPVARESCGDAAIYAATLDRRVVQRALDTALFDDAARAQVLAAAPGALARFAWHQAARQTIGLLEASA